MEKQFVIARTSVYKNPFIGLFMRASDRLAIISKSAPQKNVTLLEETLKVRALPLFISQSPLVGLFSAMNSTGIVLSEDAEEHEKHLLKREGLNLLALRAFTPGNNILCNDRVALLNPAIPYHDAKKIGDCLGVEVVQQPITRRGVVGALNSVTNNGLFAYNEITEVEFKRMQQIFGVQGARGTCNMGSTCNALGVVANSNGALVGDTTSGFEVQRIYSAFSP